MLLFITVYIGKWSEISEISTPHFWPSSEFKFKYYQWLWLKFYTLVGLFVHGIKEFVHKEFRKVLLGSWLIFSIKLLPNHAICLNNLEHFILTFNVIIYHPKHTLMYRTSRARIQNTYQATWCTSEHYLLLLTRLHPKVIIVNVALPFRITQPDQRHHVWDWWWDVMTWRLM